jgi:sn-glycerol 3-phosphate transport system substrate-binding protein
MRSVARWSTVPLVLALALASCSGGGDDDDAGGGGGGDQADCPIGALDQVDEPVEITFWHVMTGVNETTLQSLTDQFNSSQGKVKVSLVNNASSEDEMEKYRAGLETGDLPDVAMQQEIYLQQMIDTRSVLPVQSCIDEEDYDTSDFVGRALNYYKVQDVQWALPFNVSNAVLLYNRAAFVQAGLDPDNPPKTLEELRSAAEAIKNAGFEHGLGLKLDAWHLERFLALEGEEFVDNGNGRTDRATAVAFDSDAGVGVFEYLKGLVDDGLAGTYPDDGPGQFDNLFAVGNKNVGMTLDSSGTLGNIVQTLESGQYADVDPAIGPMPGLTDNGGALIGGGAIYLTARDEAKQAAAWEYMKFLTTPESQSKWAAASGYLPVRQSAVDLPELQARWTEIPGFKVAYDQLLAGAENDATAGAVIGDFTGVRNAIEEAENKMFLEGISPADAIAEAAESSNAVIEDYNDRVGG